MSVAPVLADVVVPRTTVRPLVREAALVLGGTVFLWALGNVVVPLPFTPVPLSLATFAVLVMGAGLGPARALASISIYLAAGMAGAPMFAGGESGWQFASFGYIVGYLAAAALVGWAARRRGDRSVLTMLLAAAGGSLAIYAIGVGWLMAYLHLDLVSGLKMGMIPFLPGDAVKIVAAGLALPATWALVRRVTRQP